MALLILLPNTSMTTGTVVSFFHQSGHRVSSGVNPPAKLRPQSATGQLFFLFLYIVEPQTVFTLSKMDGICVRPLGFNCNFHEKVRFGVWNINQVVGFFPTPFVALRFWPNIRLNYRNSVVAFVIVELLPFCINQGLRISSTHYNNETLKKQSQPKYQRQQLVGKKNFYIPRIFSREARSTFPSDSFHYILLRCFNYPIHLWVGNLLYIYTVFLNCRNQSQVLGVFFVFFFPASAWTSRFHLWGSLLFCSPGAFILGRLPGFVSPAAHNFPKQQCNSLETATSH